VKRLFSTPASCIIIIALLLAGPASGGDRRKVIAGGDHNNPPYEFLENGKPTGFNIELMRAVAEATGMDVEFRLGPWEKVREDLVQGRIDALAGMYYSAQRNREVDFSVPHTMVSAGLFARKESPLRSFADIKGKEVIVQKGDVINDYLRENRVTSNIVAVTDPGDVLRLLASGRHDCALMPSRLQGEYLARALGLDNIKVLSMDLPQFRYCFAVRKGDNALLYRLDEGLNILKVNGKYKAIYEKWFGVYEQKDLWQTLRYYVLALTLALALALSFLIWSKTLKRRVELRTSELRENEEKFRVLAETSQAAICVYQGENHVYVNAAMTRQTGYTEQELMEMRFWEWMHEDDMELVRERGLARQRGEQVPSHYEIKCITKEGVEKWLYISAGRIEFKGKPAGIVTMFDITDRKRMEEELRQAHDDLEKRVEERTLALRNANELLLQANRDLGREVEARKAAVEVSIQSISLLKATLESTADGILVVDRAGSIIDFNERFLELWHISRDVIVSLDDDRALIYLMEQLINPDEFVAKVRELCGQLDEESLEVICFRDGRVFEWYSRPQRVDNEIVGRVWSFRDITDRKRSEEALHKANMVVEHSPVVLFRCKAAPDWPVELVSRNVIQFGYTPEEFLSGAITFSSIIHPQDLERVISEMREYAASGVEQLMQEYRIVAKGGEVRWIIDQTYSERNEAGEVTHYEGIVFDVSERKQAEEALRESEALLRRKKGLLEELNRTLEKRVQEEVAKNREKDMILIHQNRQAAMGEILEHIAHQWKQPLNILNLIMYDMEYTHSRGKLTDEQVSKTLDNVTALTENMSQTINLFRDFYKPDREKTLFSIRESIDIALSFIMPALRYDSIEVELDADPELSAIGYPKEYAQVFINIMTNARDALKEKGAENPRINIRAFADDNKAIVDITDNAGGIPEGFIDKIFDIYFTTKGSSGGTGIGLYMSKKIIERNMGGTLSVCNVEQGAQFRIALDTPMDIEVYNNSLPC
jgi:PAS domain S-box-containing protein